ncbi:hypothetical protein IG631_12697 [Alternaria alternata]|nr:hypothetical protein IG631_12697 [Alternaria alternata]
MMVPNFKGNRFLVDSTPSPHSHANKESTMTQHLQSTLQPLTFGKIVGELRAVPSLRYHLSFQSSPASTPCHTAA